MTASTAPLTEIVPTHSPLTALAEQLRDGPLQRLIELQLLTQALAPRLQGDPAEYLEELGELVRLSMTAMDQFHAFTRELQTLIRDLSDVGPARH